MCWSWWRIARKSITIPVRVVRPMTMAWLRTVKTSPRQPPQASPIWIPQCRHNRRRLRRQSHSRPRCRSHLQPKRLSTRSTITTIVITIIICTVTISSPRSNCHLPSHNRPWWRWLAGRPITNRPAPMTTIAIAGCALPLTRTTSWPPGCSHANAAEPPNGCISCVCSDGWTRSRRVTPSNASTVRNARRSTSSFSPKWAHSWAFWRASTQLCNGWAHFWRSAWWSARCIGQRWHTGRSPCCRCSATRMGWRCWSGPIRWCCSSDCRPYRPASFWAACFRGRKWCCGSSRAGNKRPENFHCWI